MESYPNSTAASFDDVMDGGTGIEQQEAAARNKAGDVLHNVKDRAERVTDVVKSKVSSASNYVKHAQAADMWGDVKELARRNPGASMLAVAVIGFAIGRSTSSSRSR